MASVVASGPGEARLVLADASVVGVSPVGATVAGLRWRNDGPVLLVEIRTTALADEAAGRQALGLLTAKLDELTSKIGVVGATVWVDHPVVRQALREAGWGGPLRAALQRPTAAPTVPAGPAVADLADFVNALVSGASVVVGRSGRAARWFAGLAVGQRRLFELRIDVAGAVPLRLRVPEQDDLLVEQVALAADVAAAVLGRFPWLRLEALSFDQGDHGFRSGRLGGYARPQGNSDLHVNAAYVLGGLVFAAREGRPGFHPPTDRTWLEDVVAHELWHAVEHDFEARRFRDSIAFRRDLGRWFGVETIEKIFDPGNEAQVARLAREVSGYATENRREATAELFTEWWHAASPRPPAAFFGELVDRYLPARPTAS